MTKAGNKEVTMDRRRKDRRNTEQSAEPTTERRKVQRRRQIDPTTCERDYTAPEIEFMQALDDYKRRSGRMFPTCSEILEVIEAMGYLRMFEQDGTPIYPEILAEHPKTTAEAENAEESDEDSEEDAEEAEAEFAE